MKTYKFAGFFLALLLLQRGVVKVVAEQGEVQCRFVDKYSDMVVTACTLLAFFRVFELYKIATLSQHVYVIELPRPWHQNNALECALQCYLC